MIRLSCWIGGVGCDHTELAAEQGPEAALPVKLPSPPLKRAIFEDVRVREPLDIPRFPDHADALAGYFRKDVARADGAAAWRVFRNRLLQARPQPDDAGQADARLDCLAD